MMEKYNEIKEMLAVVAQDVIELLKIPADMVYKAATGAVRVDAICSIFGAVIAFIIAFLLAFATYKLFKSWNNAGKFKGSEDGSGFYGAFFGLVAFFSLILTSMSMLHLPSILKVYIMKLFWPDVYILLQIVDRAFN